MNPTPVVLALIAQYGWSPRQRMYAIGWRHYMAAAGPFKHRRTT